MALSRSLQIEVVLVVRGHKGNYCLGLVKLSCGLLEEGDSDAHSGRFLVSLLVGICSQHSVRHGREVKRVVLHHICELLSVERLEALIGLTQVVGLAKVVGNLGCYFG
jgi:hypothetical protein